MNSILVSAARAPPSSSANQRVFNLVNMGEVFEEIVQHPDVVAAMNKLLGGDFILSGFSSNTTGPGGEENGRCIRIPATCRRCIRNTCSPPTRSG